MLENNYYKFLSSSKKYLVLLLYISLFYFIYPIILGLFLAYLCYPLFQFIHRQFKIPFFFVVIIISSILFSLIGIFLYFVIQSIIELFPSIQATLQRYTENEIDHVIFPYLVEKLTSMIQDVTLFLVSLIKNSLQSLIDFFLVAMAFYFSIFESKKNRLWFFIYVPKVYRTEWSRYFTKVMSLISYFIFVAIQLFTLTFLLLSAGFYFLSFDAPILKAFVIALADALPFLGIGIFLIPLAIYFFIINQNILALAIVLLYIFVLISRQLVESMLWSHTLHIRMIHTFLISAASILIFGVYGILLSPILLMVAMKMKQSTIFAK